SSGTAGRSCLAGPAGAQSAGTLSSNAEVVNLLKTNPQAPGLHARLVYDGGRERGFSDRRRAPAFLGSARELPSLALRRAADRIPLRRLLGVAQALPACRLSRRCARP